MIRVDTYRGRPTNATFSRMAAWRITQWLSAGSVNFRSHRLWRKDNRYPGTVAVRRHECGGLELSFDALRHGAKPRPPVVIDPADVDPFIVSCLEVRQPQPTDNEASREGSGPFT